MAAGVCDMMACAARELGLAGVGKLGAAPAIRRKGFGRKRHWMSSGRAIRRRPRLPQHAGADASAWLAHRSVVVAALVQTRHQGVGDGAWSDRAVGRLLRRHHLPRAVAPGARTRAGTGCRAAGFIWAADGLAQHPAAHVAAPPVPRQRSNVNAIPGSFDCNAPSA